MLNRLRKFHRSEHGAVTVDWVVLTAALVGLAGAVYTTIQSGTGVVGSSVERTLGEIEVQ